MRCFLLCLVHDRQARAVRCVCPRKPLASSLFVPFSSDKTSHHIFENSHILIAVSHRGSPVSRFLALDSRSQPYTRSSTVHVTVYSMSIPRATVSSLLRRAFAARRPLDVTSSSSCCRPAFAGKLPTLSHTDTTAGAGMGCCSQLNQQRAGLCTLRRGLTGPLSSRLRLPMRGLEEFRDLEIVKVRVALGSEATLGQIRAV